MSWPISGGKLILIRVWMGEGIWELISIDLDQLLPLES